MPQWRGKPSGFVNASGPPPAAYAEALQLGGERFERHYRGGRSVALLGSIGPEPLGSALVVTNVPPSTCSQRCCWPASSHRKSPATTSYISSPSKKRTWPSLR